MNMLNIKKSLLIAFITLCFQPELVQAIGFSDNQTKPVMIVRFSEEEVNFMPSLEMLVKKAMSKKPGATFHILALAKDINDPSTKQSLANYASISARKIQAGLLKLGISPNNITMNYQLTNDVDGVEVQIFIK
jgi:hypothetical protein